MNKYERQELAREKRLAKLNPKIMKEYPWFDYSYLLELMEMWLNNASERFSEDGTHVGNERQANICKRLSLLLKRLKEDDYSGHERYMKNVSCEHNHIPVKKKDIEASGMDWDKYKHLAGKSCSVLKCNYFPDEATYSKQSSLWLVHDKMQRQQDKEYFCKLFMKHLESIWD